MRRLTLAAAATVAALGAYAALSMALVSASLRVRAACPPGEGPPPSLTADARPFTSRVDGTRLAGWIVPPAPPAAPDARAIVLVHGVDTDGWAGSQPDLALAYHEAGFHVLVFDLRGHGRSGGDRLGLGALERSDIRAAVDVLLERGVRPRRIGLHGTSYGAAMALLAAAEIDEVGAIVADSAYADIRELMARQMEVRTRVPAAVIGSLLQPGILGVAAVWYGIDLARLAPESAIARIAPRPMFFIHGRNDRVIPVEHSERLNRRAGSAGELWILNGAGHTGGMRMGRCDRAPSRYRQEFARRVVSFFDRTLGGVSREP